MCPGGLEMNREYTKEQIEQKVKDAVSQSEKLYNLSCVNHQGCLRGSTEPTSDYITKFLLGHLDYIGSGIQQIRRGKTYMVKHIHKEGASNSNRKEEICARNLVFTSHTGAKYGVMIGYQIPLKNSNADKGAGKIDLVSYHADSNTIFLHEFKRKESSETLLRCVLEIYTYYSILDRDKFLRDFNLMGAAVVPSVLVCDGSRQHEHYDGDDYSNVRALMERLNITFHLLEESCQESS